MDDNVFGKPVIEGTRLENAREALNNHNVDNKLDQAIEYVERQKENFGNGIAILGIFYNATGETLLFDEDDRSYGEEYDTYPRRVQNGQWGAFLFTKKPLWPTGATGYVVYRGKYDDTNHCKQLLAWDDPFTSSDNHAYCKIYDDGSAINKIEVYNDLGGSKQQHACRCKGMYTTVSIDRGPTTFFKALLTVEEVAMTSADGALLTVGEIAKTSAGGALPSSSIEA